VTTNRYARWWCLAVFAGIVQDWIVAIPGIFAPNLVLRLVARPVQQPVWPAFACLLLFLLSLFYIPGARDPFKYRTTAILTVVARGAGVIFFLGIWRGRTPAWFGYLDLAFTIIQGSLLWKTYQSSATAATLAPEQRPTT
jgi:hypothetical protein